LGGEALIAKLANHRVEAIDFRWIATVRGSEVFHRRFESGDRDLALRQISWVNGFRHTSSLSELYFGGGATGQFPSNGGQFGAIASCSGYIIAL